MTGELPLPLYDDYPMIIDRIILKKEKFHLHWWKLYRKLSSKKFDIVIDFRSSLISYFLSTKKKIIFKMKKKENIYFQIHQKYETDIKKDCKIITDRVRKFFQTQIMLALLHLLIGILKNGLLKILLI